MGGYCGKILHADLTKKTIVFSLLDNDLISKFIGGRGINSKLVYEGLKPNTDPLGPENVLVFGAGPLVGTLAPAAGRYTVSAKSPLIGLFTDSNSGGHFGPELKFAGIDHVIITGRSDTPVYLYIQNNKAELRPAAHLWGLDTWETEDLIRSQLGDASIQVASIGPAGENQVRLACIINNKSHAAGRTGLGAVMGSKNLKAIAVRGSGTVEVAHMDKLKILTKEFSKKIKKEFSYTMMSEYGTQNFIMGTNVLGALVIRNWSQSADYDYYDKVNPIAVRKKHYVKRKGCFSCPIACGHICEVQEGPFAGERGGGLEHGVTTPFGIGCGISDTNSYIRFNNQCNRYGIDALEFGLMMGSVIEWFNNGLIDRSDTNGIELGWGDYNGVLKLLEATVNREGFGEILAMGSLKAAETIGGNALSYLNHIKGMNWGADDVRPFKGYLLSLATSTRGADHLRGMPTEEVFYSVIDPLKATSYDKASLVIHYQRINTLADAIGICKFVTKSLLQAIGIEDMLEFYNAVTGKGMNLADFIRAGDRIYDLERFMHAQEGITRQSDLPVGKWANEPIQNGPFKGESIDLERFNKLLDEYYQLRGWDVITGNPDPQSIL
ncbi:MAG: aldehyde ferredoxin oxidoreductase family protein [Deltaproteobacteria bacterium]|nr:aldehyde ferredoxin oxidoreductase family protein [Deltaproteobacteria bacterium]